MVLPASFPNLLANGAQGIAVGMATAVPPHNVAELCSALLHLVKFPNARVEKLVEMVPGPDFPTGGTLVEDRETIVEAYRTGTGRVPRARPMGRGKGQGRRLPYRRRRDPLPGAKVAPGREDRRASGQPQAGHAGRRARRVRGRSALGAGAQEPQRRSHGLDGIPVPPDRAGKPGQPQPQCAGRRAHAPGHELARGLKRVPRSSPGRVAATQPPPFSQDRNPARDPRRLPDRLSQPGRGDSDHSL